MVVNTNIRLQSWLIIIYNIYFVFLNKWELANQACAKWYFIQIFPDYLTILERALELNDQGN